jgi:hypothetical protein
MRMIHCLIQDGVKEAFLQRHDCFSRDGLDARNSPNRPRTWVEVITDKFNDIDFSPDSEVFPNLHEDFASSINLDLDQCPCVVSVEQVKSWIADRKAKLVLMINRWERSGNGDGQRWEEDRTFGHMESIHYQSENRSQFLQNDRSTLLYYWQMLDNYDMISNTVSILPADFGISSSTPSTTTTTTSNNSTMSARKNKKQRLEAQQTHHQDEQQRGIQNTLLRDLVSTIKASSNSAAKGNTHLATAAAQKAKTMALNRVRIAEQSFDNYMMLTEQATNPSVKAVFQERLGKAKKRLDEAEADYDELNSSQVEI